MGYLFNLVILTMSGNAICDGKSDYRGSDDNGIFIQFSKFSIFTIFVFL